MSLWIELICQAGPAAAGCAHCGAPLLASASTLFLVRDGIDAGYCGERCLLSALAGAPPLTENWLARLKFYELDETGL